MPGTCAHTRELWMWVPVPGPGLPLVPGGSSDGQHSLRLSTQNADLGSPPPQLVHSLHHPACSFPKHVRPVEEPAWPHNFILVPFNPLLSTRLDFGPPACPWLFWPQPPESVLQGRWFAEGALRALRSTGPVTWAPGLVSD